MIWRKDIILLLVLLVSIPIFLFWAINTGSANINWLDGFSVLFSSEESDLAHKIIVEERLSRAVNAIIAGGALGLVGLVLQSYFRNPLAGPGVLGISSGASLGVALALLFPMAAFWGPFSQYFLGLIGSFSVIGLLIFVNKWIRGVSLLVVGLMISFFTSAFVSALLHNSTDSMMRKYIEWGFGSFGTANYDFYWFYVIAVLLLLAVSFFFLPKILNVWVLGEQMLLESGQKVKNVQFILLAILGSITALITVQCGPISFIGIAIPQVARMLLKSTNHIVLMPASFLLGSITAILADIILRTNSYGLPLNGILALFGAPVIIYVILKTSRTEPRI